MAFSFLPNNLPNSAKNTPPFLPFEKSFKSLFFKKKLIFIVSKIWIMKNHILVFVVFISAISFVNGQKFESVNFYGELLETSYIDSNTGDTIRTTFWKQVNDKNECLLNFRMLRKNSVYALELSYHFGDNGTFQVSKGDSVWIKFSDGAKLVLFSRDNVTSTKGAATIPGTLKGAVTFGVAAKYDLSQEQISGFIGKDVEKVRIFSSKGYNDFTWRDRKRTLTDQSIKQLMEKRAKYEIGKLKPDNINKENANKDNF